ncbi:hypothetical protein BS50DRAFT_616642 [Corynespora cassiicola Philippines]|uniref:Uncharacterized protein n=1 Tax=Corynespora cassiicola Philippines TaxID=1448308 RepID=A0A2T2P691_CORCC|nr:hypothetical protein BS50DRAFT_616642 [Corynespora cassiicola Philippines]
MPPMEARDGAGGGQIGGRWGGPAADEPGNGNRGAHGEALAMDSAGSGNSMASIPFFRGGQGWAGGIRVDGDGRAEQSRADETRLGERAGCSALGRLPASWDGRPGQAGQAVSQARQVTQT